jgi:molybdate-binding protein/DNA-binding transcriptional regulator YhcF (GntR family)
MTEPHLYERIADSIRQQILNGELQPGDRLPPVREMAKRWDCTPGTIQRAYQDLAQQGLILSRAGQGTRVVDDIELPLHEEAPLRRAALIHRAEAYFLEMLTTGFTMPEIEDAMSQAMDRWRAVRQQPELSEEKTITFCGSHDLVITWLSSHFNDVLPGWQMSLQFSGSLGGLIALAEGRADVAGSHLWDKESNTFNMPFIRRILPGTKVAVITVAKRRLGLMLPPGNPDRIHSLEDLQRKGLRFVNRQKGSGTRVWLDSAIDNLGIPFSDIQGYEREVNTHSTVARMVAEGEADVGIGLEASARSFDLDFIFLRHDRYDLVVPEEKMSFAPVEALIEWLSKDSSREIIHNIGGYEVSETGKIEWVE